ncbi:kinesin-like protein [Chrysochromulina tobinii]|uniref:Kinesin-like protein n=1 Tax=Chrysochromulina tobinii TaxID=1460289 RepID=A0A0M0K622_9EUKA|nr:kinesin-like protein [Chrysochromulina tobinii]|eukprot:KOO33838.1 kinesin-like protein [Chrysochromulina sp. CCMP291]
MPSNTTVTVTSGEEEATFTFDACFAESAAQHEVYTELVASPMAALFDGFNCTILAYGQTGSGKTFSMMGSSDETASPAERARAAGIIPRFGAELFERVGAIPGAKVHVSYCQLHNETFFDLLDPSSKAELRLRRSEAKGVHVQGLSEPRVQSAKELLQLLAKAEGARITAATKMNAHSSRSHALLTLALTLPARSRAGGGKTVTSRAHLVDLAGSERYKDAGDAPARQQEAIAINQSLTTLGLGGASSATGKDSAAHVPYRNSKLTHLLKESLGGSALCVMLCTISPSISSLHESLSTLHFASRARAVVNVATRNLAHEARSSSVDKKRDATPPKPGAPSTAPKLGADATPTKGGGDAQYGARQKHRPPRGFGFGASSGSGGSPNGNAQLLLDDGGAFDWGGVLGDLGEGAGSLEGQVQVLKEKLRHVARAAERAEEGRKQQGRIYKSELKRAQDGERDKAAEIERLRWELDQLGEREASRSKVNLLQDEVRNFKTASQHKLQQMELQQVREREASQAKRLRELEDEIRGLRGTGEKKVREALDEEKAMVRAFHKRQREANSGEAAQEREGYKKRLLELEAEVKVARSLAAAQVDEASQTHAAELGALQRRVAELEDEKGKQQRSFEQRLADEKGHRYGDVQERERRRLAAEEAWKAQLAEARREAAEASVATQAAHARGAALMQQVQQQQAEVLSLQQQLQMLSAHQQATSPEQLARMQRRLGELERSELDRAHERRAHERELEAAKAEVAKLQADLSDAQCNLDEAEAALARCQAQLTEATSELSEQEELRKLDREEAALSAEEAHENQLQRWLQMRTVTAEKLLHGARERLVRIVLSAWARYARTQRLLASRERAAQLVAAADQVRRTAEDQSKQLARQIEQQKAITGESIDAPRSAVADHF